MLRCLTKLYELLATMQALEYPNKAAVEDFSELCGLINKECSRAIQKRSQIRHTHATIVKSHDPRSHVVSPGVDVPRYEKQKGDKMWHELEHWLYWGISCLNDTANALDNMAKSFESTHFSNVLIPSATTKHTYQTLASKIYKERPDIVAVIQQPTSLNGDSIRDLGYWLEFENNVQVQTWLTRARLEFRRRG